MILSNHILEFEPTSNLFINVKAILKQENSISKVTLLTTNNSLYCNEKFDIYFT